MSNGQKHLGDLLVFRGWETTQLSRDYFINHYNLLGQWLNFETFWDYIFSRENKPFKLFFQGPGRLSENHYKDPGSRH